MTTLSFSFDRVHSGATLLAVHAALERLCG